MMTGQRNKDIAAYVGEGKLTFQEIGDRYGLTGERVRQIAAKQGITWPHGRLKPMIPDDKISKAVSWIARGMPVAHAADAVGINRGSLSEALHSRGLRERYDPTTPWTKGEETFLREHYKLPTWSATKIGKRLGGTKNEVIGKARRIGLHAPLPSPKKTISGRIRIALAANPDLSTKELARIGRCSVAAATVRKWAILNPDRICARNRRLYEKAMAAI